MSQERILVVDDDEAMRSVIGALLESNGYKVTMAQGAAEALSILQKGRPFDAILSDVMMPGVDGLSLLQSICLAYPGLPVVMITSVQDVQVATNAFRSGAVDYLVKPFVRAQLESAVERALERGRTLKQNTIYRQKLEAMVSSRTTRLREAMIELERSYDTTLEAMGNALDLRDEETEGHAKRVTAYTIALAREMGLNATELKVIARGAFLHDIGKIATPDSILLKPGQLNPEEMSIMREHCRHGYDMVCKIPFLKDAAEIVYAHQERFDGTGYPRGLRGEEIPLGARIFAIADALDAMTSDRPYRRGMSFEAAREEIVRCTGTQFDPAIVEIFLQIPIETWDELRVQIVKIAPAALSANLWRPTVARSSRAS